MLIGEPARTQGDLNFQIGGIPVRVTPWFWIIAVLLGWSSSNNGNPRLLLTWVLAVFASIMIHELGHALAFRYYGDSVRMSCCISLVDWQSRIRTTAILDRPASAAQVPRL